MNNSPGNKKSNARYYIPAAVAAGALGARLAWRRIMNRGLLPQYAQIAVPALDHSVEILRDNWAVPHIYASSMHDLFFAQGFVHAQDRLFQMEVHRRAGSGRISELVGPAGLPLDRVSRYFGWQKAIQAQVDGADSLVKDVLSAYSAGVNAYIASQPLPPEFVLLRHKPEPWGLADTAAIGTVLAWGLSVNWETELLRMRLLEALGPDKAFDLTPLADDRYVAVVPDSGIDDKFARELIGVYRKALAVLPLQIPAAGKGVGSNNWVVAGDFTASGRPILANDPHLPPTYPALWYENHLIGGDFNVTGFSLAGVPGVVIGHNESVAWGFTNAFPDIQDIYLERFHEIDDTLYEVNGEWVEAEVKEEVIRIRGRKPQVEKVRYTRHGPVFSDIQLAKDSVEGLQQGRDLALRWSLYSTHNHLRTVLEMNLASNWREFHQGLRFWGFPSQNVVYADVEGDIGYVMPGKVPLRRQGAGLFPVPGWNDEHEWMGWITHDELPFLHNPEEGKIVTANNRVVGASYPYLLTGEWLPDYRARRIHKLLDQASKQTLETHARIQMDTVSIQAGDFLTFALPAMEETSLTNETLRFAVQVLKQWNGDMRADLVAPSLYYGWLFHFSYLVVHKAVGLELAARLFKSSPPETFQIDPFLEIAIDLSLFWLKRGSPDWVGDIFPLLVPALRKTIRLLQREFGANPEKWLWGNLHYVRHEHLLSRVPGLGRSWKTEDMPVSGDGTTINQADITPQFPPKPVKVIASCRLIMDVGGWDNSLSVLPGGQSGNPASPHYEDGLLDWRDGRYHPLLFSRARIEEATEKIMILTPHDRPDQQDKSII
jgi:penicillin G amidase